MLRQLMMEQKRPHIAMLHKHVIQDISVHTKFLKKRYEESEESIVSTNH